MNMNMILEFDIPEDNPFQNDKLEREVIAENLEKIIDATNGSLVLSIDAGWGNGKTTFINMWKKWLDNTGKYTTLYFNAWENDDCEDPLLALISELEEILKKDENKKVLEKIKHYGKPLLKNAIPTAFKIATGGIIDIALIKEHISDANEKHLVDLAGKLGEFELFKAQKISKAKFKDALADYQKSEGKKIVFFIDELDRCRPTFAIETLEKIKHLFNINDFIFVLALDKKQLSHSIKTLYGQEMDSVGYLRRFIDLEFVLPEPFIWTYLDYMLSKFELTSNNTSHFEYYLKAAIQYYTLSLRDIDKLFYYLVLLFPTTNLKKTPSNGGRYLDSYLEVIGIIYAVFPVLRIKNNELYQKFVKKEQIDNAELLNMPHNKRREKNGIYRQVISNIILINNMFKDTDMDNISSDSYAIKSEMDYQGEFNILSLLNDIKTEFAFIKQMEFMDNFVVPNND